MENKSEEVKGGKYGWRTFYTFMNMNIETCQSYFKKERGVREERD
jgi:hypothetical protein